MQQLALDWAQLDEQIEDVLEDEIVLDEQPEESRAYRLPELIRPYQGFDGAAGHLKTIGRGFCTLPPGLGKTESAILACLDPKPRNMYDPFDKPYRRPRGTVLIVCPSLLTDLWFDRIVQYLPEASVVMASGDRRARQKALNLAADWYIINYEMLVSRPAKDLNKLTRDPNHPLHKLLDPETQQLEQSAIIRLADLLQNNPSAYKKLIKPSPYKLPPYDIVIFDESHHLANHESATSKEAAALVREADKDVYMLTGTPIRREPDDLYAQYHILYPHAGYGRTPLSAPLSFSVYDDFKREYCVNVHSPWGNKVVGRRTAKIQQLMDATSYFCSYEDAGIYLPPVQNSTIRFPLDDKHADAYKQISLHYAYQDIKMYSSMEVMHALRAVTFTPAKVENALNLSDQFPKILFYTWYISSAQHLADALSKHLGRTIPCVSSAIPEQERLAIVDAHPPVLVATLGTLSEGKDLSYMQAVCFVEGDWTPYKMQQALSRVQRSGSTMNKVMAYYLVAKDTIDETILAVSKKRGATAKAIVERQLDKFQKQQGAT